MKRRLFSIFLLIISFFFIMILSLFIGVDWLNNNNWAVTEDIIGFVICIYVLFKSLIKIIEV